jgi:hypothetical protein
MSRSSPFTIERLELEKALAMMNVFASVPEAINSNKNENIADIIKSIASQKLDSIDMDNVRKNIDIYANEIAGKALDKNQETTGGATSTGTTGTGDGNSGFNETKNDILIPTMVVMPQVAQKIAYFDNDIVETYISTDDKNLPKARISQLHSNEELEKTNIEQARVNNQALIDKIVSNIDNSLEREKLINSGAIYSQDMVDQVILEQNKENEHSI